jgi:hypothetical protein
LDGEAAIEAADGATGVGVAILAIITAGTMAGTMEIPHGIK